MQQKINTAKKTWNLSPLLKSDTDPEKEKKLKKARAESYKFITKWQNRSDYLTDPKILKTALDEYAYWIGNYGATGDVGVYFSLRAEQEQDNPKIKAEVSKLTDISTAIYNDSQFFELRLAKIPAAKQKEFLKSPYLAEYTHYLHKLFTEAKYLLSEEEEKVLNLTSETAFSNWVSMVSEFVAKETAEVIDEKGKKTVKPFSEVLGLLNNKNKKVRDRAAREVNKIFAKHSDTAEHEINSVLKYKKVQDELRKMHRPDLSRHIADDIDSEVVDALVKAVSAKFSLAHRYYKLKAQLLKVDKLEYHERSIEYGNITKKYTYQNSIDLIGKTFNSLDTEFGTILKTFVENGQLDVYPRKGKSGGGFCAMFSKHRPVYILLNHNNKLGDVLVIAHEMGHGINDEYKKQAQHELNLGSTACVAEVASTFMEDFVLQEILKSANEEERLTILMQKLNDDVSTIFRQIAAYRFEQELHALFRQKGYLPKTEIGKLFTKHMSAYMGNYVNLSAGSENSWVYWSHFRMFFYVYSYASGLLISKTLQSKVKTDPKYMQKVKTFMSAGTSESPKTIFKKLGVDISDAKFWNEGLREIEDLLKETESLAKKLKKI